MTPHGLVIKVQYRFEAFGRGHTFGTAIAEFTKLATSRHAVIAAGFAHGGDEVFRKQELLKLADTLHGRRDEFRALMWVKKYQVDCGRDVTRQFHDACGICYAI